jgi:chromosome partitioning protein
MKSCNCVFYASMKTLVWNSQKGGSGKTSLCAHVAVEVERVGNGPVYLIDTDPQGTLSTWHESREAETPHRVEVSLPGLPGALATLAQRGATFCMIDTAPTRADENAELFRLADLVLVKLLKQIGTPFLFVVNQATLNANITAQAIAALSHHGPVAQTIIVNRVPYAAAMTDGHAAGELMPKGPAAVEIAALWKNIKSCLHENMNLSKVTTHA